MHSLFFYCYKQTSQRFQLGIVIQYFPFHLLFSEKIILNLHRGQRHFMFTLRGSQILCFSFFTIWVGHFFKMEKFQKESYYLIDKKKIRIITNSHYLCSIEFVNKSHIDKETNILSTVLILSRNNCEVILCPWSCHVVLLVVPLAKKFIRSSIS